MKVKNIETGEVADCEWRTDHPESIRLTELKINFLRELGASIAERFSEVGKKVFWDRANKDIAELQAHPEPVLVVKETGELFRCNPSMMECEGDPAGPGRKLQKSIRRLKAGKTDNIDIREHLGRFLDENLKPMATARRRNTNENSAK